MSYGIKQIILIFYLEVFKVILNIRKKINWYYKDYFKNSLKVKKNNKMIIMMVLIYKKMIVKI